VRVLERCAAATNDPQGIRMAAGRLYPGLHGPTRNELHDYEPDRTVAIEVKHADDARMRQALQLPEFVFQTRNRQRVGTLLGTQQLYRKLGGDPWRER
jgi:hypothetical protein